MDGLEVDKVVVSDVNADAEIQACVPPVHDLEVAELNVGGLVGGFEY